MRVKDIGDAAIENNVIESTIEEILFLPNMKRFLALVSLFFIISAQALSGANQVKVEWLYDTYRARYLKPLTAAQQVETLTRITSALETYKNKPTVNTSLRDMITYLQHLFCHTKSSSQATIVKTHTTHRLSSPPTKKTSHWARWESSSYKNIVDVGSNAVSDHSRNQKYWMPSLKTTQQSSVKQVKSRIHSTEARSNNAMKMANTTTHGEEKISVSDKKISWNSWISWRLASGTEKICIIQSLQRLVSDNAKVYGSWIMENHKKTVKYFTPLKKYDRVILWLR